MPELCSKTVKVVKQNHSHMKLLCICDMEFWVSFDNPRLHCPHCKIKWHEHRQKGYRLKVRHKLADDYKTMTLIEADHAFDALSKIVQMIPALVACCSGFIVEEITMNEIATTQSATTTANMQDLLVAMGFKPND